MNVQNKTWQQFVWCEANFHSWLEMHSLKQWTWRFFFWQTTECSTVTGSKWEATQCINVWKRAFVQALHWEMLNSYISNYIFFLAQIFCGVSFGIFILLLAMAFYDQLSLNEIFFLGISTKIKLNSIRLIVFVWYFGVM